jgi:hypothetical protein
MRAYEFPAKVTATGNLEVPTALLDLLSADQTVRVIVLVEEPSDTANETSVEDEDAAWERLGDEEFLAGYSEADAVYDRM